MWEEPRFKKMLELREALSGLTQMVLQEEERKLNNFRALQENLIKQRERNIAVADDKSKVNCS